MIKERAADWHTELDFWKHPHFRSLLERLQSSLNSSSVAVEVSVTENTHLGACGM